MAAFDKSMDKEIFSASFDSDKSKITVAVFSYNNGQPKLQLSRENKGTNGEMAFAKLGRLTRAEVEKILPLMEKAKTYL
ncbi:hypothetical protein HYV86_00865 [Candidatus Woesearchaeota archaeon]|nr:hypothetical protein [Candidatus Woesearchaeota archaeon]